MSGCECSLVDTGLALLVAVSLAPPACCDGGVVDVGLGKRSVLAGEGTPNA